MALRQVAAPVLNELDRGGIQATFGVSEKTAKNVEHGKNILGNTATGAITGAMIGGPIGAAIGGGGGLLFGAAGEFLKYNKEEVTNATTALYGKQTVQSIEKLRQDVHTLTEVTRKKSIYKSTW